MQALGVRFTGRKDETPPGVKPDAAASAGNDRPGHQETSMKHVHRPLVAAAVTFLALPTIALADSGAASPTLSFFSGGDGGQAHWVTTSDQPPGDTDHQAIQLDTTNDAPTFAKGYAGILVHHVTGIPAAAFPDSSFWLKAPAGPSLGSPRLVVEFQTATGAPDGYADLRPLLRSGSWQQVSDVSDYPNSGWDVMGGSCAYLYNVQWNVVQTCFAADTTLSVYLVADAYGLSHLIDDITVDGKTFSSASDNGSGSNTAAGPAASAASLLPSPLVLPG